MSYPIGQLMADHPIIASFAISGIAWLVLFLFMMAGSIVDEHPVLANIITIGLLWAIGALIAYPWVIAQVN